MLELRGVTKTFGDRPVLRGIDLTVEKGEVVAIIGPSGAGKTTLLRCVNCLERADSGAMIFNGVSYDLSRITPKETLAIRRRTGFVFQSYNLFRNKTALQNVTEGLTVARKMPRAQAVEIAEAMLDRVGLLDRKDAYPSRLSGGQQQRVAIARAMATSPDIIYFDEPTSALDPELTGEVLSVMRDLARSGMTMLVVTHELAFAKNAANRVVFMEDGTVVESAPAGDFFTRPQTDRAQTFLKVLDGE